MAFTDAEKTEIKRFLGIPPVYNDMSIDIRSRIEKAESDATVETAVRTAIEDAANIEEQLRLIVPTLLVKAVDSLTMGHMDGVNALRSEGRRVCSHLAALLDLDALGFPVGAGVFGALRGTTLARAF